MGNLTPSAANNIMYNQTEALFKRIFTQELGDKQAIFVLFHSNTVASFFLMFNFTKN